MNVDTLQAAADQGDASAQCALGNMYATGRGVAKNEARAVQLCQAAADQGHAAAQCNLGVMYATGRGAAKNEARAAALSKGIVAMRRIHRAFPHFSHTPYRFDAAPNAVHAWDAGFDVRAYATHGVMHGVYHYLLRGPVPPPEYPYVS